MCFKNFKNIGMLAQKDRSLISEIIEPVLKDEKTRKDLEYLLSEGRLALLHRISEEKNG